MIETDAGLIQRLSDKFREIDWVTAPPTEFDVATDLIATSPNARIFLIEFKLGRGELRFDTFAQLESQVSRTEFHTRLAAYGILATTLDVSSRLRALVATRPIVLVSATADHQDALFDGILDACLEIDESNQSDAAIGPRATLQDPISALKYNADLARDRGDLETALNSYSSLIDFQSRSLGPHHPATLRSRLDLARLLRRVGNFQAASDVLAEVLALQMQMMGPGSVDVNETRRELAALRRRMGDFGGALEILQLAADELREFGRAFELARILEAIASTYALRGDHHSALTAQIEAWHTLRHSAGERDERTLRTQLQLANRFSKVGEHAEARRLTEDALFSYEEAWGTYSIQYLRALAQLSLILSRGGDVLAALESQRQVVDGRERLKGQVHPTTLASSLTLVDRLADLGSTEEAISLASSVAIRALETSGLGSMALRAARRLQDLLTDIGVDTASLAESIERATRHEVGADEFRNAVSEIADSLER